MDRGLPEPLAADLPPVPGRPTKAGAHIKAALVAVPEDPVASNAQAANKVVPDPRLAKVADLVAADPVVVLPSRIWAKPRDRRSDPLPVAATKAIRDAMLRKRKSSRSSAVRSRLQQNSPQCPNPSI